LVAPREVEAAAIGSGNIRVDWLPSVGATSYAIERRQPDTETEFTRIATNVTGTTFTDTGLVSGTLYEYAVVAQQNPESVRSKQAQATADRANLTAYRPQSVQDPNNPVDAPIYAPFRKRPVLEQDESSNTLGPGIRANWDIDNGSFLSPDVFESGYEIELENDLIEVKVNRLPGQGNLVLTFGTRLGLYYTHDKETPIPTNGSTTEPLEFGGDNTVTVFVEYRSSTHGADTVSLVDQATSTTLDSLRFHSFRSLVVVFGGRGQDPRDTDGDGSIGDGGGNREGIFDVAQTLYDSGWDVMAFESTNTSTTAVISVAEEEIKNAWDHRFISLLEDGDGFAVFGYSWGGGAAHDLVEELYNDGYPTIFTLFLDAVEHGVLSPSAPQNDWPAQTFYLLNIWQPNQGFLDYGGDAISNPEEMAGFSELEEFPLSNHNHRSIDDDPEVHQQIITTLGSLMRR
jgi:hypothetical protein